MLPGGKEPFCQIAPSERKLAVTASVDGLEVQVEVCFAKKRAEIVLPALFASVGALSRTVSVRAEPAKPDKMVQVVNTSSDLNWLLTRNTSSFLLKRRGVNHFFSTDPLNGKGLHKPRFSGTVQKRALTVQENPSGKGITLVYKNKRNQTKPAKAITRVALNRGTSRALKAIKQLSNKQQYRTDLKNVSQLALNWYKNANRF